MNKNQASLVNVLEKAAETGSPTRIAVLAVGDTRKWSAVGHSLPSTGRIAFAAIEDITDDFLQIVEPETVISPLLARSFDCSDLAGRLYSFGFRGRYRAVSDEVPNPDIICREIRVLFPGLDFDVISETKVGMRLLS